MCLFSGGLPWACSHVATGMGKPERGNCKHFSSLCLYPIGQSESRGRAQRQYGRTLQSYKAKGMNMGQGEELRPLEQPPCH